MHLSFGSCCFFKLYGLSKRTFPFFQILYFSSTNYFNCILQSRVTVYDQMNFNTSMNILGVELCISFFKFEILIFSYLYSTKFKKINIVGM